MFAYILAFLVGTTLQLNEHAIAAEPAACRDPWLSQDKFLHFSISAAITGFSYYTTVGKFDMEPGHAGTVSISFTALIGIGKEVFDKKRNGRFSWKDLFWDGAGITVGYFVFCN